VIQQGGSPLIAYAMPTPLDSKRLFCETPFAGVATQFSAVMLSTTDTKCMHAGLEAFDKDGSEARRVEASIGLPVLHHRGKKPSGSTSEIERLFKCEPHQVIFVGDRYLTDVVFGTMNGMLAVRVAPFETRGESVAVAMARIVEGALVAAYRGLGMRPLAQRILGEQPVWEAKGGFVQRTVESVDGGW
jgi:hypothetical protein